MHYLKDLEEYVSYRIEYLENKLPETSIIRGIKRGQVVYRTYENGIRHEHFEHTPTGKALAIRYAEIENLKLTIADLKNTLHIIRHNKSNPKQISNLKPGLTNCKKYFGPWDDLQIAPNPYPDHKVYIHNGVEYDSKAEVFIAEIYEMLDIPFKHSVALEFEDFRWLVDFVPLIEETGDYYLHEHFGNEMEGRYFKRAKEKFAKVHENKLIFGKDVLFTYENQNNFANHRYITNQISSTINNILLL